MYNILIIDDNEWVVADFKTIIDWEKYDINLFSASNGEAGLEFVNTMPVDAVFTDIKMPGISGIEVLKRIKSTHSHIPVIIISAYEEFSLARDAIKHGALDYITKPINKDEITNIVENFLGIIYSREKEAYLEFQRVLAQHLLYIPDHFEAEAKLNGYLNGEICAVAKISPKDAKSNAIEYDGAITNVQVSERIYYVIFKADNKNALASIARKVGNECMNAGFSQGFDKFENLATMISQANHAYQTALFHHKTVWIYDQSESEYLEFKDKLNETTNVDMLWNLFFSKSIPEWELKSIAEALNIIFKKNIAEKTLEKFNATNICEYENAENLWSFLQSLRQKSSDVAPGSFEIMNDVITDIDKNFCKKLSLREYAQKYYMSEAHFSKTFKLYTGKTFTEHIRKLRFERACILLTTTKMSVLEIALELGYDDYYHFSKQFKRIYSISPTNYRKLYFLCN